METETTTTETATETPTEHTGKKPSSTYYTAVVFIHDTPETKVLEFVTGKTKVELLKTLGQYQNVDVKAIFKGKRIQFALQQKIAF